MFAIGLGLKVEDFTRVVRYPRAMLVGLLNQIILLPLIGLAVLAGYEGRPEFALGIMILVASPGGITSNLLTALAGGNAALSVSMTAVTSLVSVVTVPIVLSFAQVLYIGTGQEIQMPFGRILASILVVSALPIVIGMALQAWKPTWSNWVRPKARHLATMVFALIVASAFVGQMDNILNHFIEIGPRLVLLNIATMVLGLFTARTMGLVRGDSIAITLECGLQNAALAIFVAVTVLDNPVLVVPAITYALIMNISAAGFILWTRRPRYQAVSE